MLYPSSWFTLKTNFMQNIVKLIIVYINLHKYIIYYVDTHTIVPTPTVNLTAPSPQTVGQSLILQCEVSTVKDITSRVDIVWSSGGTELGRTNNVASTTTDNSLVHKDLYIIALLSTLDDGRVIQCEVVINAIKLVTASNSITLAVTGKYSKFIRIVFINAFFNLLPHSSYAYSQHITIWSHTRSYGG